jgi:CelD/BcsL family acetyltransferase involved in cellulose biosynthesis
MPRVEEINEVSELGQLKRQWEQLLARTPRGTFFQSLEWLEVYWQHYGAGQRLRVLLVSEGAELIGIVPLTIRTEWTRVGRIRFITYPLDYWGSFYGPIGQQPALTLYAAMRHLKATSRDWDAVELRWVGGTEGSLSDTVRAMREVGMRPRPSVREETAVVELTAGWEWYFSSRPGKWRNNYRRSERVVSEAGEVEYERYRPRGESHEDCDPRWDLYNACLVVASASWQGSSNTGTTLTHDSVTSFLRDAHVAAVRRGAADVNLLRVDGVPVAFAYNYCYQGNVYGLRAGFNAQTAPPGAGNLLLTWALRDSFERGDRIYDLGTGYLDEKRHIRTNLMPIYRCGHFPWLPLRSQLLRLKRDFDSVGCVPT